MDYIFVVRSSYMPNDFNCAVHILFKKFFVYKNLKPGMMIISPESICVAIVRKRSPSIGLTSLNFCYLPQILDLKLS